jgi:hypothetical protein
MSELLGDSERELEAECGRTVYGFEDLFAHEDTCSTCLSIRLANVKRPLLTACLKCKAEETLNAEQLVEWRKKHPNRCRP